VACWTVSIAWPCGATLWPGINGGGWSLIVWVRNNVGIVLEKPCFECWISKFGLIIG
jgi:hypothetical protein